MAKVHTMDLSYGLSICPKRNYCRKFRSCRGVQRGQTVKRHSVSYRNYPVGFVPNLTGVCSPLILIACGSLLIPIACVMAASQPAAGRRLTRETGSALLAPRHAAVVKIPLCDCPTVPQHVGLGGDAHITFLAMKERYIVSRDFARGTSDGLGKLNFHSSAWGLQRSPIRFLQTPL